MKKLIPSLVFIAILSVFLTSCVTKKKYRAEEGWVDKLQRDSSNTHKQLDGCNTQVKTIQEQLDDLQRQYSGLQGNLKDVSDKSNKTIAQSKLTIAEQAKRLKDLQDLIQSQKDVMNRLRKSIADALVNFKPDELSVYIKDGNVYVSLQEKLLFKSGSAVVDPKGKEALGTLASVLNNTTDVNVDIEGHTDTIPIKRELFPDNWALSTARAVSIVRILTKDYGVDTHRITASGRGEFHPVATNDTPEGRAANRRTEIILSPNLTELYKLLGQ
jgi:chemotaxis protein MotB